jgi:uncharacterized alkaline shock family protein YloU
MSDKLHKSEPHQIDTREFDLPETVYSRDIENRVFQGIIVKTLSQISGIGLLEGRFFDNLIGRIERIKGISTQQDATAQSLKVRIEVNIQYGISIAEKAEEIQAAVVEDLVKMTGVRVSEVHVVFKGLISEEEQKIREPQQISEAIDSALGEDFEEEL